MMLSSRFPIIAPILFGLLALCVPLQAAADPAPPWFVEKMSAFPQQETAAGLTGIGERIGFRARQEPFLVVASVIFVLAILHTFLAGKITRIAHRVQHEHDEKVKREAALDDRAPEEHRMVSFKGTVLHFLGEIEAVFGIWAGVLLIAMLIAGGNQALAAAGGGTTFWSDAGHFLSSGLAEVRHYMSGTVHFVEPMFVVVIMALASTRPVLLFAEKCLRFFARMGGETPAAWWLAIMLAAPVLGSFITEPGAMTIAALLLGRKFYRLGVSPGFAYATLGLLFVSISIGGVLTNFAAPPVLMVARAWDLSSLHMLEHFGTKALPAILVSTLIYFLWFRKELGHLSKAVPDRDHDGQADWQERDAPVPVFVTVVHLFFLAWTVLFAHDPPLFVGGFLFFLAFASATRHHQNPVNLRGPVLVGFFLAGLVVHGGLQGWWLSPILASLSEWPLFIGSTVLTSFNDNAAITYLASQVPGLSAASQYAVLAGAVAGGGLTVIANAPNPAGQSLLGKHFPGGISPGRLLLAALLPTLIAAITFMVWPGRPCIVD